MLLRKRHLVDVTQIIALQHCNVNIGLLQRRPQTGGACRYDIGVGFVTNMRGPGTFHVNDQLAPLVFEEQAAHSGRADVKPGFIPAVKLIAKVAGLSSLGQSIAVPDVH